MARQLTYIGGFATQNSGTIKNSYSVLHIQSKGRLAGGFCAENSGHIEDCYCCAPLKGLSGGFVGTDKKDAQKNCYFFHTEKRGSKNLEKLSDSIKAQRLGEIKDDGTVASLGFDTKGVWKYLGKEMPVGFIPEQWSFAVQGGEGEPIRIRTADELAQWAARVNKGDKAAACAAVVLEKNIDLSGKEWTPIGESRLTAFCGVFDGKSHTVFNFKMNSKKRENKGFFGFLKGEVYNLAVDCSAKGGNCIGGLAAQNEGGTIGCCSAVVSISGKQGTLGGLVGYNTGEIFESYAAGKISAAAFPLWWWVPIVGLPLLAVLILALLLKPQDVLPSYAPVPYDEDQVPIQGESAAPVTSGNFVSFQFEQKITVSRETGLCSFNFKNPGNSNHNIVVQLQFTDAEAIRVMGSTGRSAAEQQKLESTSGYDPETYRTVIAESGAIKPGYELSDLRLVQQKNGATIPAGTYNAMVYLIFYDTKTNNRAMLESQLPVEITVQ